MGHLKTIYIPLTLLHSVGPKLLRVFAVLSALGLRTRGSNGPDIDHLVFVTIYQSPPMDGSWLKFANIHAKSRGSGNKSSDISKIFSGVNRQLEEQSVLFLKQIHWADILYNLNAIYKTTCALEADEFRLASKTAFALLCCFTSMVNI